MIIDYIIYKNIRNMTDERLQEIIQSLPSYIRYENGKLFNSNSRLPEGIEGDYVTYYDYDKGEKILKKGTVIGYTDYQVVMTKEWGMTILSAENARTKRIEHKNKED